MHNQETAGAIPAPATFAYTIPMTLRTFLGGSLVGALLGALVWLAIVFWLDPLQAGAPGFILFFLALFLATASTASLAGYGIRRLLNPAIHPAHHVRPSLRQGILLGLFLDVLLFLQLLRLSRWWLTLICIIFFVCFELIFTSYDRNTRRSHTAETESV